MNFKEHIRFYSDVEISSCPKKVIGRAHSNCAKRLWQNLYMTITQALKWLKSNIRRWMHGAVS